MTIYIKKFNRKYYTVHKLHYKNNQNNYMNKNNYCILKHLITHTPILTHPDSLQSHPETFH